MEIDDAFKQMRRCKNFSSEIFDIDIQASGMLEDAIKAEMHDPMCRVGRCLYARGTSGGGCPFVALDVQASDATQDKIKTTFFARAVEVPVKSKEFGSVLTAYYNLLSGNFVCPYSSSKKRSKIDFSEEEIVQQVLRSKLEKKKVDLREGHALKDIRDICAMGSIGLGSYAVAGFGMDFAPITTTIAFVGISALALRWPTESLAIGFGVAVAPLVTPFMLKDVIKNQKTIRAINRTMAKGKPLDVDEVETLGGEC